MDDAIKPFTDHLQSRGYSITKPRKLVFKALLDQEAMSMSELITALPSIDRASIYRTVELFIALGVIERIQIGWKYKIELSDAYSHHHHHMSCINCGRLLSFAENRKLESVLEDISREHQFTPTTHQIEIRGYCNNCRTLK